MNTQHSAVTAVPPSAAAAALARRQLVTFALNGQIYCVDILSVREIRILENVTPVPGAHADVKGVINLRGSIVPVIDLRQRFCQGETAIMAQHPAVIVSIEDRLFGLLVDAVNDIVTVSQSDFAPVPETSVDRTNAMFQAVVKTDEGMVIMVDLKGLVARAAN